MKLRSFPKASGYGTHRILEPAETFRRVRSLMTQFGVTRLADLTGLDRLGIPTYSATVPRTRDVISVYNGKGTTKIAAKVGAFMEAIERSVAMSPGNEVIYGTYAEMARKLPTLDPEATGIELSSAYAGKPRLGWMRGFDLLYEEDVLVPAELAAYNALGRYGDRCFHVSSTNGLASGNVAEEAICHALCEIIERDSWTMAELVAQWLPLARQEGRARAAIREGTARDDARYPTISFTGVGGVVRRLLDRYRDAGLKLFVRDITSELGIPTVIAVIVEEVSVAGGMPLAHLGLGCHPDADIAVTRALTEAAQSRVVDIQGIREDLAHPDQPTNPYLTHTKRSERLDPTHWLYRTSDTIRHYRDLPSYKHEDILEDITLMLDRLRADGIDRVVAVNLSTPATGVAVVRVIAPGVESFAADRRQIGWRASRHWMRHAG